MTAKKYDLEERTEKFARNVRITLSKIEKTVINLEDIKQVIRSSGSVGANYSEANDSLSDKDFEFRIKICRKEAKESKYWFSIMLVKESEQKDIDELKQESIELMNIFGAILKNFKQNKKQQS
jgi:four helix bundle protein